MSFICLLSKNHTQLPSADPGHLASLLCPYSGNLTSKKITNGKLLFSELAALDGETLTIPKGSRKNPQTAWAELSFDGSTLKIRTDPLGTFPLWYLDSEELLIVTSEVKSLIALKPFVTVRLKEEPELIHHAKRPANYSPYENVHRVQPGAELTIGLNHCSIQQTGGLGLVYEPEEWFEDDNVSKEQLAQALQESAKRIDARQGNWGTFLSGGIDSSTATSLLSQQSPNLHTYTLGTEFGDEYADAAELAEYLGIPHHRIFASEEDALEHFKRAVFSNEIIDGLTAETVAQLSILGMAASEQVEHIVTGYGADLLFGSMLRHQLYMQVTGVDDLQSLIERTCWTGEFSPFFAWSLGLEVHHLFWDPQLMNTAFRIPADRNFDGEREKVLLRNATVENNIMQHEHAFRKKHAMTDGTQFNRVLSRALGLEDNYAYDGKSYHAVNQLKKLFEP